MIEGGRRREEGEGGGGDGGEKGGEEGGASLFCWQHMGGRERGRGEGDPTAPACKPATLNHCIKGTGQDFTPCDNVQFRYGGGWGEGGSMTGVGWIGSSNGGNGGCLPPRGCLPPSTPPALCSVGPGFLVLVCYKRLGLPRSKQLANLECPKASHSKGSFLD